MELICEKPWLVQKHLKAIEKDRKPYTLEADEVKVQESLLKRDLSRSDSSRLSRQLSKRYPGVPLTQALRSENEMLRQELQNMRVRDTLDPKTFFAPNTIKSWHSARLSEFLRIFSGHIHSLVG